MKAEMKKTATIEMLDRLGEALGKGDLKTISANYGYPALILQDEQVVLLESAGQLEIMFEKAREWYLSQGSLTAKAEIQQFEEISDSVVSVDVRWPGFDKDGIENYTEASHYLIYISDGTPQIRAAVSRTK